MDKFRIAIDPDTNKLFVVLKNKSTWENHYNHHKYINDKNKCKIKTLHNKRNWKEIGQASLDNIELPLGTTSFSHTSYKDLVFNFKAVTGEVISIQLSNLEEDYDIQEIFKHSFNPCYFRTDFPVGLVGTHLTDFATIVLYELYSNAQLIDQLIDNATLPPRNIVANNNNYYFQVASVNHNTVVINVTDETGEPNDINDWSINSERKIILSNGYELDLEVGYYEYKETSTDKVIIDNPLATKHIETFNFTDDKITLTFPDGTFNLDTVPHVLLVRIGHDENDTILLTQFLYYTLEATNTIKVKTGNDWVLTLSEVIGSIGDTVQVDATVDDPSGELHSGVLELYLENNEDDEGNGEINGETSP